MAKKERGPQYIMSALNTPMINYNEYYMNGQEKFVTFLISFVGGGLVGLVFYGNQFLDEEGNTTLASMICNLILFVVIGLIAFKFFKSMRTEQLLAKRKKELRKQFRSFLETLAVSLSSGMNILDSLLSSYNDLKVEYSEDAYIVAEVKEMIDGMQNNVPIEDTDNSHNLYLFSHNLANCVKFSYNFCYYLKTLYICATHELCIQLKQLQRNLHSLVMDFLQK